MAQDKEPQMNTKLVMAIAAFALQSLGTVIYYAQQHQRTIDSLEHVQVQLQEIKSNQTLLTQVVTDVAILKVQQAAVTQSMLEIKQGRTK
jgi:hypothetical protein